MAFQVTDVQKALAGADYPADGRALGDLAQRNGAADDVVEALRSIDREVEGPSGVMHEMRGRLGNDS